MSKGFLIVTFAVIFNLLANKLISQEIISQPEDSITINNLITLGNQSLEINLRHALKYFSDAEKISSKIGYRKGLAQSFYMQGITYKKLNSLDSAYYFFSSSLFINRRLGDKLGITKCLIELALYNQQTEDYAEAIRNYFRSLDIMLENPDTILLGTIYHNLGSLYLQLNKNKRALEYSLKAYKIEKQFNDSLMISKSLCNLGQVYLNLDSLKRAEQFFQLSIELNYKMNNKLILAESLLGKARLLGKNQKFEAASGNYQRAIQIFKSLQNKKKLARGYYYFSNHLIINKKIGEAHNLLMEAFNLSKELPNLYLKRDILKRLQEINSSIGNFEGALYYSNQLKKVEEKLKIPETLQYLAINEAELNYKIKEEKLKLEHEKELNKQKTTKLIFVGSSLFAFVIIILILFMLREKNKHNKLLKKANDTRDKMFRLIAHDFRSPLISISNTVRLIPYKLKAQNYDAVNGLCDNVTHSVNRVLTLIDNLINWALSQHGNIPYNPENYNLAEITDDIVEIYRDVAGYKKIELSNEIPDSIEIFADKNILNTVLRNLVNNAIKFTPENGNIHILADVRNEFVTISVKDNGIGISKENLKKIFDVDKEKGEGTKGEKGNGLGLFFCKEFVQKNKGKIWVESVLGQGSTFSFTLPHSK